MGLVFRNQYQNYHKVLRLLQLFQNKRKSRRFILNLAKAQGKFFKRANVEPRGLQKVIIEFDEKIFFIILHDKLGHLAQLIFYFIYIIVY